MGFYRDLSLNTPIGTSNIRDGDNEILAIKTALHEQWPNFTSAPAFPSIPELNALQGLDTSKTIEERLSSLEAKNRIDALPAVAYDFNNSWWQQPAAEDEGRFYSANQVPNTSFTNAPWGWGSNGPGDGRTYSLLVQKFINDGQGCAVNLIFQRTSSGAQYSNIYYRQATSSAGLPTAPWMRATFSERDDAQSTSGDTLFTSAKPELEDRGCTPCP